MREKEIIQAFKNRFAVEFHDEMGNVLTELLTTYRAQVLEEVMQAVKTKQQEVFNRINDTKDLLCFKCRKNITHGSICYTQGNCPKHPTN